MNGRRWWLPGLGVVLWLVFFWGVAYSPWRTRLISADGDAALHWRLGSWMSAHQTVIRVDSFSYTRPAGAVVSKEWLSELVWGAAGRCWSWNGLVLVAGLLIATTLYLLSRQLVAEGSDELTATLLVLTAALTCSLHWLARPLLVTHLLVVVFNWLLRGFDRRRVPAWVLWASLVPLMGLWANLHGAFPVGLVLIGLYVAGGIGKAMGGQPGEWRRTAVLAGVWLAGGAATLVNPNGWRLHEIILYYLRHQEFVGGVSEFLAPDFHAAYMWGFEAQLVVLALVLLVMRGRWAVTEVMLVLVWGYFALHSVRNVPVFGLVVAPICAEQIRRYLQTGAAGRGGQWYRQLTADITAVSRAGDGRVWIGLVVAAVLVLESARVLKRVEPAPEAFPAEAVQFLRAHPEVGQGRMFNPDHWGGYLLLELPERKVFLDSRHEFYGAALLADYNRVVECEPDWLETLTKYQVDWTLLPAGHPVNQLLALRREWRRVYADRAAVIYRRR
jgi:hypothetical protein